MKNRIVLGFISLVFIVGAESTAFSQDATKAPQSIRAEPRCPQLVKIVNGKPIRPGAFPLTTSDASGEKFSISVEMAMTPLEFGTVAEFKMRVPASVLNISTRECDDRGRFRSMQFNLYWVEGRLSASAELPKLQGPKSYGYGHKLVRAYGHFLAGPYGEIPPEQRKPYIERERKWYGPPVQLPQFGFTAYPRIWRIERSEKIWDAFVLNTVHGWTSIDITYLCEVDEAELLSRKFKPRYGWCRAPVGFRNGFGATVDIGTDLLPDAAKITEQLIRTMNSYVVKE